MTATIYPAIGGGPFTGEVIGADELRDLAVVRFCCSSRLRALELAGDQVPPGVEVVGVRVSIPGARRVWVEYFEWDRFVGGVQSPKRFLVGSDGCCHQSR